MVLLSLLPQIHLWMVRGKDWNGAYVYSQGDEPLYSAYVNALINGRTRKNDPFGGTDSSAGASLPESIFSIQFVPAYATALPARVLGISASTAFIVLIAVAALLTSLSVFRLIQCVTSDHRLAAAGTLFVLCLGRFVGRYGLFGTFLDIGFPALPFLRRYEPSAAFPLFFVFQLVVWRALTNENKRRIQAFVILAGLILALLVFSYLYLWTAAAVWLGCIGLLWFYFRPSDRWKTIAAVAVITAITAVALAPYAYMVLHRAPTLDEQQILVVTHQLDLFRVHEILCMIILVALIIGVWRSRIDRADPRFIYAASLAILPFIIFNQQVFTGRTMQVFHFENFVLSYSTLVGLLIMVTLFKRHSSSRGVIWMATLSFAYGIIAVGLPSRLLFMAGAISNDKSVPVLMRLQELSRKDGTFANSRTKDQASTLVFSPSVALVTLLPTWTSQGTLLDVTGADCRGETREERKEIFYMHLYYCKVQSNALRKALNDAPDESADELSNVRPVIFGHERVFPYLSPQSAPIQQDEIELEVQAYEAYIDSFSREEALKRPITYAVIPIKGNFDFTNLDRWYERDAGERVGDYTLYRLKLRD